MSTKESIELEIEQCQESLYTSKYEIRWFTRNSRMFVVTSISAFGAFALYNLVPVASIQIIAGWLLFLLLICVLGLGISTIYQYNKFSSYISETADHLKAIADKEHRLKILWQKLKAYEEHLKSQALSPEHYMKNMLPSLITTYRQQSTGYRIWFVWSQVAIIFFSVMVTSVSGGWLDRYVHLFFLVPVLSICIALITSLVLFLKPKDRAINLQRTADAMDLEHTACSLKIGDYKDMKEEASHILLAERTEALRKEQQQRQQQLEQSSNADEKSMNVEKQ